ncbi:MAG: DUF4836 family protein [Flammeovirgaceae bacterium]
MTYPIVTKAMKCVGSMLAALVLFSSCTNKQGLETKVPKEASGVVVVNTTKLGFKLLMDQITLNNFRDLMGESNPGSNSSGDETAPKSDKKKWGEALSDPTALGIDIQQDAYFYVGEEFTNNEPQQIVALLALSDKAAFEEFLENDPPNDVKAPTQQGKGFRYRVKELEGITFGWDKHTLAIVATPPHDQTSGLEELTNIFNRPADRSMKNNSRFADVLAEGADIGIYLNLQGVLEQSNLKGNELFMKEQWVEHINAFLSFDDGEISVQTVQFAKQGKADELKLITQDVQLKQIFDLFNMDESLGFLNFRYHKESIRALVAQDESLQNRLRIFLVGMQLSEDEFFNLFEGNLLLALTGVQIIEKESKSFEMDENFNMQEIIKIEKVPEPSFLAAMTTAPDEMNKLLAQSNFLTKEDGLYKINPFFTGDRNIYLILKDNLLLATSNPEIFSNSFSNSGPVYDLATQNPISFYLNTDGLIDAIPDDQKGRQKPMLDEIRNYIKGVETIVAPSNGEQLNTDLVLKFKDQDRNGLSQLIEMVNSVRKKEKNLVM